MSLSWTLFRDAGLEGVWVVGVAGLSGLSRQWSWWCFWLWLGLPVGLSESSFCTASVRSLRGGSMVGAGLMAALGPSNHRDAPRRKPTRARGSPSKV